VRISYDRAISESWRHLSAYRHSTCLPAEQVGGDWPHLLALDRVRVGDDTFSHLVFSTFYRVWSQLLRQEWAHNLLNLLKVVSSDLFNQFFMFGVGSKGSQRLLWLLANIARYYHRFLTITFWIHDRIEHPIWLRSLNEAVIVLNSRKLRRSITSLNIKRLHFFRPLIRTSKLIWISRQTFMAIVLFEQCFLWSLLGSFLGQILSEELRVHLVEISRFIWSSWAWLEDVLLVTINQVLVTSLHMRPDFRFELGHLFIALVVRECTIYTTCVVLM